MPKKPNIVFVLADQLRAAALPAYGGQQIETPHLTRLANAGTVFTNAISTCPVCTPYRAMLVTGRHPQSTGHLVNFLRIRHDEISIGDAFSKAGYNTAWIGKWHLHTGSFPTLDGQDYVPEGRDRLGFEHWRAYNFHTRYFDGTVGWNNWRLEHWNDYETDALLRYSVEFLDQATEPFCMFVSPHQPHFSFGKAAPEKYYDRLPPSLPLPANVPDAQKAEVEEDYRHYLAMTLAVDDMIGGLLDHLDARGLAEDTIFVFASDHGSQMGSQGHGAWQKKMPYEESLHVPLIARWPEHLVPGTTSDVLTGPVDLFPTLCSLCDVPIPATVEGYNLADAWLGKPGAFEQDALLTMNFTEHHDYLVDGGEWRGVRTKNGSYIEWLDGRTELFDLRNDPLEMNNLAGSVKHSSLQSDMKQHMCDQQSRLHDEFLPGSSYNSWLDYQRRVVRNALGPLPNPEAPPVF